MKLIAIGDIHGREHWKRMVANEPEADKIVFIGDYFDSFGISANRQIVNFKEILQLKRDNPDKVVLLLGNHDFHYISEMEEAYSGYNSEYAEDIEAVVKQAIKEELVQMAFQWNQFLFTHAGVTNTWYFENCEQGWEKDYIINKVFKENPEAFKFTEGMNHSMSGNDITQTPIWVRPESLLTDMPDGIRQVVGHTTQEQITIGDDLILIDCIGNSGEYLVIEDDSVYAKNIPYK